MKGMLTAICCVVLATVPAMGQKKAAESGGSGDQKFMDFAAQTDMVEANLGQMASSVADSQDVKDYAQMLVTDHTKDYQQLKDIAKQANLNVPDSIDAEHNKMMVDPFQKLKGAAFDKKYMQEMVSGHTKAIAMYKKEEAQAKDATLKSYITEALPVLQKHLDQAKQLASAKPAGKGGKAPAGTK